jgi:hypothetical protein
MGMLTNSQSSPGAQLIKFCVILNDQQEWEYDAYNCVLTAWGTSLLERGATSSSRVSRSSVIPHLSRVTARR